ncbi:hypothetical protein AX15_007454 [Amanita polypyramis BW_CC]|nr:hypothetical protein AX15_007454 [Amanita polypyramis BW_CC]
MRTISFLGPISVLCTLIIQTAAYFSFSEPKQGTKWKNNGVNVISWKKGKLDGIDSFDIEFTRSSSSGNWLVAKGVSSSQTSLNIMVQNLPPGDDYFVIFMNSTHGVVNAVSPQFSILDSSSSSQVNSPASIGSSPTVTVASTPNPTQLFATTFPAGISSALALTLDRWRIQTTAMGAAIATSFIGALWTVL